MSKLIKFKTKPNHPDLAHTLQPALLCSPWASTQLTVVLTSSALSTGTALQQSIPCFSQFSPNADDCYTS